MAAHLKDEFMEDEKCHNLMRWLNYTVREDNRVTKGGMTVIHIPNGDSHSNI